MKAKHIITALAAAAFTLSSCNGLLDIPQHGIQSFETYYQTDEEAESAIIACYIQVKGNEMNAVFGKNLPTDDFWAGGEKRNDNADYTALNEFTFGIDNSAVQGLFESYYNIIYKANVVLGHVPEETDVQKRARAEAKVFRAWSNFELISMWGTPPLVDHELAPSEYHQKNGNPEDLWALVEKDLTEAISSGYLTEKSGVNDKTWRITKQFAQALLGKAYLWQEKYAKAAETFDLIVESDLYELYADYENILAFSAKQNCESMFESVRIADPNNTWANFTFHHIMLHYRTSKLEAGCCAKAGLSNEGWGFLTPQKNLYDDFVAVEGEDGYRLKATMKTYSQIKELGVVIKDGEKLISEGFFMWKWRSTADRTNGLDYVDDNNARWMRYAEVLLCAAEAHYMNQNGTKADEYMNMIRTRAQAPTKSGYTLEEIKREKRIELCGESVRFQDIIRWGIGDKMANQGKDCPWLASNGNVEMVEANNDPAMYGFKSRHNLFPFPGAETRVNPNIVQNTGW